MKKYDVCILGGGAAGLAAAAELDKNLKTCLCDRNKILGRKILATGGGRCNITNASCIHKDMTLDFFKSLGMELYCDEEGRYYPYSNQASDVVKVLEDKAEDNNVDIMTDFSVEKIIYKEHGASGDKGIFLISNGRKTIEAEHLILAPGGKAAPIMGTTGDGYKLARDLGHSVNKIYPILTGIECGDLKDIKGVRAKGKVSLYRDGECIKEETGEIQFNEDGISGICVMNLTLYITFGKGENIKDALKKYSLMLDLAPDFDDEDLKKRKSSFGILSHKLAQRVSLNEIKSWKLPVKGVKGWKNAQCTGGGISIKEVDMESMESNLVKNLYVAGEILDIQGPCGGYNLQNAWETGLRAARHINSKLTG